MSEKPKRGTASMVGDLVKQHPEGTWVALARRYLSFVKPWRAAGEGDT